MEYKEIQDMPVKELELKLRQNRAEQMTLRAKKSAGQLEKPHMLKLLRRDAARFLTALTAKNTAVRTAAKAAPVAKEAKVAKAPKAKAHNVHKKVKTEKAPKISKAKASK